jgi:exopolyphosphatase/guanosine-5'-triphosphate,3'-diphosphate pyrophosphatase
MGGKPLSAQIPASSNQYLAAIDLGSNSFHMVVARVEQGQLVIVDRLREMVRLAASLDEHNYLTEEGMTRALECLARFGQRLEHIPAANVRAVGTNTLRRAKNSALFLRRAEAALGHTIGIISGYEEARLVYLGVAHSVAENQQRRLVMDIGGGSTEIIIGERFVPLYMESLFMGCVSMTQSCFPKGKISTKAFKQAETRVMVELEPYISRYRELGWSEAVGSSGTIRSISKVLMENGWGDGTITLTGLQKLKKALIKAGDVSILLSTGLSERRAPVFAGGLAILIAAFKSLGIESMQVSTGAVREGLLYELLGRSHHHDVRDATIAQLIERFSLEREHSQRVSDTALSLHRQVCKKWRLDEMSSMLLGWAASLHEIGLSISHDQYHKHGAYILGNIDLAGFSRQEQQALALLIRNHRRSLSQEQFDIFPKDQKKTLMRLAILLRLSVLLHRSRSPEPLPNIGLKVSGKSISLAFPPQWLDAHPLSEADLYHEAGVLEKIGLQLRFA